MSSSFHIYARLLGYTKPYRRRLVIGIVCGFLVGGSLVGMLGSIPDAFRPIEQSQHVRNVEPPATASLPESASPAEQDDGFVSDIASNLGIETMDQNGRMTWQFMLITMLGLPLFALAKAAATYLNRYFMHWVGGRVMVDVRNELFSNLQRQSLVFFGRSDVGELISRCTNDVNVIEQAVSGTVAQITRAPFEILAPVLFALYYSWKHGLFGAVAAILLVFPLCIIPIVVLGRHVKRHSRRALSGVSRLVSRMQETFSGIRLIKACHMEETESRRFAVMNAAYFKEVIRALRAELLMTPLMEAVGVLCACAFLVFCFARGIQFSQIATVGAAAILAYRPVRQLAKIQATLQRSNAAAERIFDLLDVDETLPEARNPVKITAFQDRVRFENVSFRYTPDAPPVLSGISFDMPRGSVIAFVGETGSGKTTVANLLARFYDVSDGVVLLDGHDVREIEIASLRALVGVVAQDTILFNDTVARNIGYGCADATPERIEEAARQANAHEFISARSEGYEFVVGEKGFRLSGGEKQRIAIARAILQNPPILILDEATSALDTVTEQMVQQAISRVMEHRTVFAIAHRLSTIRHADLICVMDRGHIVERGTHQELYDQGGRYRDLCDMQFS